MKKIQRMVMVEKMMKLMKKRRGRGGGGYKNEQ